MNIVGASGGQILKLPIVIKSAGNNDKKIKEKREFLRKIGFPVIYVYLANERSGACVNRHVSSQIVMSIEHFSAMVARECFNRCDRGNHLRQFLVAGW